MHTKKVIIQNIMGGIFACLATTTIASGAFAAADFKTPVDDICSKVQASDNLGIKDYSALIERTDKLVPEIQASDDRSKKVYLQRLKKCRSFFEFMIETKKGSEK